MKVKVQIIIWCIIGLLALFSSCTSLGPRSIIRDRFDYTTVLSDSWKEQMLLNIVRIRYGDAPVFLDVASVIHSYELSGSAQLNVIPENVMGGVTGIDGRYASRPTITYTPLTGEKLGRSLMSPIPVSPILNLIQSGYRADLVFRIFVQSINGLDNRYGGRHPGNTAFYRFTEKIRRIQDAGAFGLQIGSAGNEEKLMIVFREKNDTAIEADITEVKKLLCLDLQTREFMVVFGTFQPDDKEIAILSRSMMQVLNDLAYYIAVPAQDVDENRVNPGYQREEVDGVAIPPLIKIGCSPQKPGDAFAAVPYQKNWFWIDNKDLLSKQLLSFLMFSFALEETGAKDGTPVVTVPVR